jgi:hypothetical protein
MRGTFAGLGWVGTIITTGRPILASEMAVQFWQDKFKEAARRAGFYSRVRWMGRELANDPFFNFAEGFSQSQLDAQQAFLNGRRASMRAGEWHADMMTIAAAKIMYNLNSQGDIHAALADFHTHGTGVLKSPPPIRSAVSDGPWPTSTSDKPSDFAQKAGSVLADFERDLPIADWQWFVLGGTFLGLVRDQDYLAHDFDLDVGLFLDGLDLSRLLEIFDASENFVSAKYDEQEEVETDPTGARSLVKRPALIKLVHKTGINLDIFLHVTKDRKIWHGSGVHRWVNEPFGLAEYDLKGQHVLGPDNPDAYLTEHYGTWRIVVKEFSCTTGTTNLGFVRNPFTIAVLLKRWMYFQALNPNEAAKILGGLKAQGMVLDGSNGLELATDIL